ncbi:MAG TPA: hypothetical protein VMA72_05200 [Streptosporangiaceae bacterium]|nr:hypothetical protein [Streptosporangiaceae bacterium]
MRTVFRDARRAGEIAVALGLGMSMTLVMLTPFRPALAAGTSRAAPTGRHGAPRPVQGSAATSLARPQWLVKSNDMALLRQQAAEDDVVMPRFTWVGCGGRSDPDHCLTGQQPIYTSYWRLRSAAKAGMAGAAVFDIEPWTRTPAAQRADPGDYICKGARLQRTDPQLKVIITPYIRPPQAMLREDVTAAHCGAYAVDIQSQFTNDDPDAFSAFVHRGVQDIRAVNKNVRILAGLATNSPVVQSPRDLVSDYHAALAAGVQGFWLNANNWAGRNECARAQGGPGCPEVGVQFLKDIGLITMLPWVPPAWKRFVS